MTTQASELELFVGSPGDLADERALVRDVADRVVAMCGVRVGVRIRVTGWERVAPELGRPQDLINPLVDSCDVFVGLLHRRWGSDSGTHTSGFAEEWDRVVSRRETDSAPAVALFFKRIPEADESDPGPQLSLVLEFRKQIRDRHIALYREFDSIDDLDRQLVAYLVEIVTRRASERSAREVSAGPVQAVAAAVTTQVAEPPGSGSRLDVAQEQVVGVLDGFRRAVGGQEPEDPLDPDRLLLLALALHRDGVIPTHVANRLFLRREELTLLVAEVERWLDTLAADYASDDLADMVIPGWQMMGDVDLPDHLARMARGEDATIARGALKMLTVLRARPGSLWATGSQSGSAGDASVVARTWRSLLSETWRSGTAMEYLAAVASPDDLQLLNALVQLDPGDSLSNEVQALADALTGDHEGLARVVVGDRYHSRGWAHDILLREIRALPAEMLASLLVDTPLGTATLREAAFQELANREEIGVHSLAIALADPSLVLNELAISYAQAHPETASGVLQALDERRSTSAVSARSQLMALSVAADELRRASTSILSADEWEALLLVEPASMADEARRVLTQGEEAWAAAAGTEIPALAENKDLLTYLYGRRAGAAAHLLARLTPELRHSGDADLVRQAVLRGHRLAKADMAAALGAFGDGRDASLLVEATKAAGLTEKQRLIALAIRLGGPEFARSLADDPDALLAEAGIHALSDDERIASSELRPYLHHANATVRMAALWGIITRTSREELQALLGQYTASTTYFYNVSAGLDRYLFAPGGIGDPSQTAPSG